MTDRQKQALAIKGTHKIFFEKPTGKFAPDEDDDWNVNIYIIVDLASLLEENGVENIDKLDDDSVIPDYSPDWLYDIIDLFNAGEWCESYFQFDTKEDAEEFKAICDIVND